MRYLLIILFMSPATFGNSDQPPHVKAPKDTIPYNKNLCTTETGQEAFSFVKAKSKFDKSGCTHPVQAWVYDQEKDTWSTVKTETVKCCDPSAESGSEP